MSWGRYSSYLSFKSLFSYPTDTLNLNTPLLYVFIFIISSLHLVTLTRYLVKSSSIQHSILHFILLASINLNTSSLWVSFVNLLAFSQLFIRKLTFFHQFVISSLKHRWLVYQRFEGNFILCTHSQLSAFMRVLILSCWYFL